MSKADLKAAMESLNVKKPLRLHSPSPTFKAPLANVITEQTQVVQVTPVVDTTQVQITTQIEKVTEVQTTTPVLTTTPAPVITVSQAEVQMRTPVEMTTEVASTTPVPSTPSVFDTSQVENVPEAQVSNATPVIDKTSVVNATPVDHMHRASDQDSSVAMEAQATPKLHNGYTRLPNTIMMRMVSGDLSRNEMKLILLIARFTISYQRRHAPLSKTVIERQTGLRGPAVLQAIADLLGKGMIAKIPGDQHRPNQLSLVYADDWDFLPKELIDTQVQNPTPVANQTQVSHSTGAQVVKATPAGVVNTTDFKHKETNRNKISLSFECGDEFLKKYFIDLKPAKKRESEWEAFSGLKQDFSEGEIARALSFLLESGTPGNGKPCHSPMAYLSMAMGEVIGVLNSKRDRENRVAQTRTELEIQEQVSESKSAQEAEEIKRRNQAFQSAFPTEQDQAEVITRFASQFPMLDPSGQIIRNLAISNWWVETNGSLQPQA